MKFHDDSTYSNVYNSGVSGIDKEQLLMLELAFLKLIDFRVHVTPEIFNSYYRHLSESSERQALLCNCSCLDISHSLKAGEIVEYHNDFSPKNDRVHELVRPEVSKKSLNAQQISVDSEGSTNDSLRNHQNTTIGYTHESRKKRSIRMSKSNEYSDEVNILENELRLA